MICIQCNQDRPEEWMSDELNGVCNDCHMDAFDWHGYQPWGNFGDGKWRVATPNFFGTKKVFNQSINVIEPAKMLSEAHARLESYLDLS